ncbi:MAG: hypothetical protein KGY41_09695 [Desulfovermiculus sp.]|nr:hypothetical protein [Desulfovermiculus sp.]
MDNQQTLQGSTAAGASGKNLDAQAHDCADKLDALVPLPAAALRSFPGRG